MSKPWENDPIVTPSGQAGAVFTLPESPKQIADRVAREEAARRAAAQAARQEAAEARAAEKAKREALEWEATHNPDGSPKPKADAGNKAADNAKAKLRAAKNLQRQLDEMREIYERSFKGRGPIQSAGEYLPSDDAEAMRAIARNMRADLKPLIRGPGEGTFTEGDQALLDQLIPDPRSFDSYNEQLFDELQSRIDGTLEQFGGDETAERDTPWEPKPEATTVAAGATRTIRKPELASKAYAMLRAGAGYATIKAALGKDGEGFTMARFAEAKERLKENPDVNPFIFEQEVPMTLLQQAAGSEGGALAANFANSLTAGLPGYIAGPEGRGALEAMHAAHPSSSAAGSVLGGVSSALGGEAILAAKMGAKLAGWAPRVYDTAYGSLSGFTGAEDGERLQGALTGAIVAPVAGSVGERAMRAAGGAVRGVTDPMAHTLRDAGVPMTVGQTLRNGGWLGRGVSKVEDALTSVPGVGNMVEARQMDSLAGFNRAIFDRAAAPGTNVTATGAEGVKQIRRGVQDAYGNALDPIDLDVAGDPQLLADITNAQFAAAPIPQGVGDNAIDALDYRIGGGVDPSGRMSGRDFQEAYRGLGRDRRTAAAPYAHEFGEAMRGGQEALADALERQQPGQFPQFLEANAANRRAEVLAQAMNPNAADELITPAQINRADFNSTSRLEGRINAASGNRPFYDLAQAGQALLPSKLPDSGTATRALVGAGLTGAFGGAGYGAGGLEGAAYGSTGGALLAALLAAGGSRPAQKLAGEILMTRSPALRALGESIERRAQIGGGFGAGILTPLIVGPQN